MVADNKNAPVDDGDGGEVKKYSFMIGHVFKDKSGKVEIRQFSEDERKLIQELMRCLAQVSPLSARALLERRIMLASEALSAGLSLDEGAQLDLSLYPDHVMDGLNYLVKIDDCADPQTMEIINDENGAHLR
jgi:hypothetical protein